jgi:diaminohydroxyphosphoribosylaminopyrimidine deaminase/5-amino-6-(5-phosphoribosylamino)uracil reductase
MPRGIEADHAAVPVSHGLMDLDAVLKLLGERGINEVQVEAGATLAGAFLAAGLVDELLLYVAPVLLGAHARPLFDGFDIQQMSERLAMRIVDNRHTGDDLRLLLRPAR